MPIRVRFVLERNFIQIKKMSFSIEIGKLLQLKPLIMQGCSNIKIYSNTLGQSIDWFEVENVNKMTESKSVIFSNQVTDFYNNDELKLTNQRTLKITRMTWKCYVIGRLTWLFMYLHSLHEMFSKESPVYNSKQRFLCQIEVHFVTFCIIYMC